ncbi:hypothetical protein [Staphylococcus lugdunensis]|uniref:Uncharacterized protein n=1 Tax=Staphylococcus lugdunensis TaxID=28035 RepID=A0ABD4EJD5_STALU|nr:hypothetical protein [Staphylococcus lugdunensis]EFU83469.1 hypothetical protein HMPREF0790_1916 [Staphylococcus lugdunensis M23590]KXA40550.1 hypothetical protein HMPREF3225_00067 [Staphylococcus lugdunensis]SQE70558.1 Uncharacterised protein [Staphylococcus lugdunensis]
MTNLVWQIKYESLPNIELNIGKYTAIYNEYETIEEDLLTIVDGYFKRRNSNSKEVSIIDTLNQELVSHHLFESVIIDNNLIENEHLLGASSILNKKIQRDFVNNLESNGYLQSINSLLEDLLELLNYTDLPLRTKQFDIKQFVKMLKFEYDLKDDYTRLIVRIEQVLPLVIEELKKQHNNQLLLIYLYPEANLSPKEQIRLKQLLISLDVNIIVLTGSMHFLAQQWKNNNYIRYDKQKLTSNFIDRLVWDAPLNFEQLEIENSLNQFTLTYQDKIEVHPTISNYQIAPIMLFNAIDLYVGINYMQHCQHQFNFDIDETLLPKTMFKYFSSYLK